MLKSIIRDAIPPKIQVPLKYYYSQIRGWLEPEMTLLPKLVKAGDRVIDIGGNRGVYAYALASLGSRVAVFEPNPHCLRVLTSWAAGKNNIDVHGVALSSHQGQSDLHIPVDTAGHEHDASASLERVSAASTRAVEVETRTLDSFGFQDVKFIKIDVEGHELPTLKGATKTIAMSMPVMLVEIEQRHNEINISEIFYYITSLGYKGFFLDDQKLREIKYFNPAEDQPASGPSGQKTRYINNFLFIPSEPTRFAALASRLSFAKQ